MSDLADVLAAFQAATRCEAGVWLQSGDANAAEAVIVKMAASTADTVHF